MPIVTLDFETAYSQEYSLSKMSEIDYVLDARYETIMCSVKEGNEPADYFVGHDAVADRFSRIDWSRTAMLAHNNRFDGSILAWRFGIVPAMYLDTLGMARALTHAVVGSSSLARIAEYLGLPAKGTAVYNMRGKWLADFTQADLEAYGEYCCHDNELCKTIFDTFVKVFPRNELALIDSVLRMFIQPQVKLDPAVLATYQAQLQASKAATMARVAALDPSVFSSNPKFAALLESYGVEVPLKISKTTGEETFALARSDRAFKELCEDDSLPDEVQAILAARVQSKSTMEEKRTERLSALALKSWTPEVKPIQPDWQDPTVGWAPVPLRYYGAHTGRFSGDGGFNWQNFKRKSMIRAAVKPPPGMRIVHRDSSQIEARMVAWLAGCDMLLEAFRAGRDVYSEFATTFYRRPISKRDTLERFVGKTCLAAGTRVLTRRGVVVIEDVRNDDLLWDGEEWVSHDGSIAHGLKETLTLSGVLLTPDHLVWCGTQWQEARYLAHDLSGQSLRSALEAASWPSLGTLPGSEAVCSPCSCDVTAASLSIPSTGKTSARSRALDATLARRRPGLRNATGNMPKPSQTTRIAHACSIGLLPLSPDVTPTPVLYTSTTACEEYTCGQSGETTELRSSATPRLCPDGMTPLRKWTGPTTTEDTSQATSSLLRDPRTCGTNEKLPILNAASGTLRTVYDLVNAGPRSRFTVLTDDGPMIVSNSILGLGYGMGWERFIHTLFVGNGGPSVTLDEAEGKRLVYHYRGIYPEIPNLWKAADRLLSEVADLSWAWIGDPRAAATKRLTAEPFPDVIQPDLGALWLPNGLPIAYPGLRRERRIDGSLQWVYDGPYNTTRNLFGGKVVENVSQALARIVLTDIILRVKQQHGIIPFLSTHDSLDYCVPEADAESFDAVLAREFAIPPAWALTLPLASEGGWGSDMLKAELATND